MQRALCAVVAALTVLTLMPDEAQSQDRRYRRQGSVTTRLGLGAFVLRSVTTDEQGNTVGEDASVGVSLLGGLSYALHPRLVADFDVEGLFGINDGLELIQLELTPGARLFLLPELYFRGAYAVRTKDPTNQLGLLGVGYYFSRNRSVGFYIEVNAVVQRKRGRLPHHPQARHGVEVLNHTVDEAIQVV